ncbi:MAG: 4-hydroxy-tetrahydrodipicolinate reductase [Lysobacterales bacterium]
MTRTLVHGAGRMARRVLAQLHDCESFELVGLVSRTRPAEDPGVDWHPTLLELNTAADLLIDFTLPDGTRVAADWCAARNVALLSGTTGLAGTDIEALKNASLKVPVLWAPNLSYGVALMKALVRQAAHAMDTGAKVTVSDIHHKHKLDAPSGTALALADAVMEGRAGATDKASGSGAVDVIFNSLREGEVVGEHTVSFGLPEEVIEITHKALDRDVFAKGALKAAGWLVKQPPGYYSTNDWLGLG